MQTIKNMLIARASCTINAPCTKVWHALINADMIKKYMFGVDTVSKWERGCPIIWTGVWQGKPYEDKGIITEVEPENKLQYTHFSSLSGVIDAPENYHTVTYSLSEKGDRTLISVTQDNNADEKAMIASKTVWENILTGLKTLLES